MFSSRNNVKVLCISWIIFSLSFLSFLKRFERHNQSFQPIRSNFVLKVFQNDIVTIPRESNKKVFDNSCVRIRTKSIILQENNSASGMIHHFIFDRFNYINPPKIQCNDLKDAKNSMIMIILSRAMNIEYRQAIRNTWARTNQFYFNNISLHRVFFVAVGDSFQSTVRNEQNLFNDVVEIRKRTIFP